MHEQDLSKWGLTRNENGAILVEGHSCDDLADRYGTPLHVVSKSKLLETVRRFVRGVKSVYERTDVLYAYKANCVPAILEVIHKQDVGAEVISGYELWLALKLGVSPSTIVFNGPLKTVDGLRVAIREEILAINIDSLDDM